MREGVDEGLVERTRPGPAFIFIGPSKAGSSWFFEILHEHPQVFVPLNKATFFFSEYYAQGIAWYERFFRRLDLSESRVRFVTTTWQVR